MQQKNPNLGRQSQNLSMWTLSHYVSISQPSGLDFPIHPLEQWSLGAKHKAGSRMGQNGSERHPFEAQSRDFQDHRVLHGTTVPFFEFSQCIPSIVHLYF